MRIIVQKFGGTSLGCEDGRQRAVDKIVAAKKSGYAPVVVVSAMGRKPQPYSTDTLLALAGELCPEGLPPREQDMLLSCGEIIASAVVAGMLAGRGYSARAVTGGQAGIITDDTHSRARHLESRPQGLLQLLEQGVIPVVAGFQGVTKNGDITTLGRGGSDTTACIVGVALNAELVEIYTDVDGIMTADPRVVPEARVLNRVSYGEVFQMADNGARVIHPRAVELAMRAGIPLAVRNTMNDTQGTRVTVGHEPPGDVLVSIAHHPGRAQVRIEKTRPGEEGEVLRELARLGVSIDLINILSSAILFTLQMDDLPAARQALASLGAAYTLVEDCCKVSAIGSAMHGTPGVMARIVKALLSQGIEVLQTADSHLSIACLVPQGQAQAAIRALHQEFKLG